MEKNIRVRVAGILVENNKILLIKHEKNGKEYWLLPGGGVDYGETFEEALIREFKEETNIDIKLKDMVIISESIDPNGEKHIINIVFIVEKISGEVKVGLEDRLKEVKFINLEEINNLIFYPNFKKEIVEILNSNQKNIKYVKNRWENG